MKKIEAGLPQNHFLSIEAGNQAMHVTAIPPTGDPIHTFRTEGRS